MVSEFSKRLAAEVKAVPGSPNMERSIEILKMLLKAARTINDTAPIIEFLEKDIFKSKPDKPGKFGRGQSMGLELASGNDHDALVRYLLVSIAGSGKRGRSIEFACRQFEFAVSKKLRMCSCLRFIKSGLFLKAVAAGVFYSEKRDSKSRAASSVSEELWNAGLTTIAEENLTEVHNLINAKEKGDTEEFKKIMDALLAKRSIVTDESSIHCLACRPTKTAATAPVFAPPPALLPAPASPPPRPA